MTSLAKEKGYQKYAWTLPFILGLFFIVGGVPTIIYGLSAVCTVCQLPADTSALTVRGVNIDAQEIGLFNFSFGVLLAAVSWRGYRIGERWAWYVLLWFFAIVVADNVLAPNPPALIAVTLSGLGLLLPYRKFFPKKQLASP